MTPMQLLSLDELGWLACQGKRSVEQDILVFEAGGECGRVELEDIGCGCGEGSG
jgi:hypothetical protein